VQLFLRAARARAAQLFRLLMSPRTEKHHERPRAVAAHIAIAGLAAVAALFIQIAWQADFNPVSKQAWRPNAALAIILATAWLLWTAWTHTAIVRSRGNASTSDRRRLLGRATLDLLVAAVSGAILFQGHGSQFVLFGLWVIPPTLIAISIPSSVALLVSAATR
jgi:hypothetical protein